MNNPLVSAHLSHQFLNLKIQIQNNLIARISFAEKNNDLVENNNHPLIAKFEIELNEYFKNPKYTFTLSYALQGSVFQKKVWDALSKIPAGVTLTYGELAKQLATSPRAIGNACRANPLPIIIPCHRVVGKNNLGGFVGEQTGNMVDVKAKLLQHENSLII